MQEIFAICVGAMLVNNVVLAQFLGICPFLGVSKKIDTAFGMGMAVAFVMVLATAITNLLQNLVLIPLKIEFLQTVMFILVVASLVQIVEIVLKKVSASLYSSLGIFLPLITTNCAILGVALISIKNEQNLFHAILFALFSAVGFTIAILLFAGIREKLESADVPAVFKNIPIALVAASILSMAFMGFSGLVK